MNKNFEISEAEYRRLIASIHVPTPSEVEKAKRIQQRDAESARLFMNQKNAVDVFLQMADQRIEAEYAGNFFAIPYDLDDEDIGDPFLLLCAMLRDVARRMEAFKKSHPYLFNDNSQDNHLATQ